MALRICQTTRPFARAAGSRRRVSVSLVDYPPAGYDYLYDANDEMVQEPTGEPRFMQTEEGGN